jgi:steroid 3-oxidase
MNVVLLVMQVVFQILVRGLIGLEAGPEMQQLKQQFQEFIVGLMSLPIKLPGTRLYRSLQVPSLSGSHSPCTHPHTANMAAKASVSLPRFIYLSFCLTHLSVLPLCIALIDHQAKKRMARVIQRIIQEKRRRRALLDGGEAPPRDAIDVLMGDGSEELTDELISDNMIDLMIPAEDSVPVLITLAVKFLSECPLALQQLEV